RRGSGPPGPGGSGGGAPRIGGGAAGRLTRAPGASLPAGRAIPRPVPRPAGAPPPLPLRLRGGRHDAGRAGSRVPSAARAAQGGRGRALTGGAVRPDSDTEERGCEAGKERGMDPPLRLVAANPLDRLARTLEALLVVASRPLTLVELAEAAGEDSERVETALGLLAERFAEGRSGIVLEKVAGGWAFRASRDAAAACGRLFERPSERGLSSAALETLAVIAYLGPGSPPEIAPRPGGAGAP